MTDQTDPSTHVRALEAILFVSGEPISEEELAHILQISGEEVVEGLEGLEHRLATRGSGLSLLRAPEGVQLVTGKDLGEVVDAFLKSGIREQLTPAAAETLAIIAYRGPIHRAGVEAIRGVNSSFTLRLLLLRGLIERMPNPKDQRTYLYQVTAQFLRHLGVEKLEDLPDYGTLHMHEGLRAIERTADGKADEASTDESEQVSSSSPI